jgi:class 3 adenylate cyclase
MLGLVRGADTERRTSVAVLFADLSGFTRLVESVDPEVVYEVVRPMMDEFVMLVNAHGGKIQQVLGDGFMSVFGLNESQASEPRGGEPRAGEPRAGDADQAVRAALALVEAAGRKPGRLPVHVGIECGEVLVSPSWEPAGYAVWGRAVTLAKRLCDLAGPGAVFVGPRAAELVGPEVGLAQPIRRRLKGTTGDVLVRGVTSCSTRALALAG